MKRNLIALVTALLLSTGCIGVAGPVVVGWGAVEVETTTTTEIDGSWVVDRKIKGAHMGEVFGDVLRLAFGRAAAVFGAEEESTGRSPTGTED